jgi:2-iminobutanoate/2-iminopropanoate deaminase
MSERSEVKVPGLYPMFSADAVRFGDLLFVSGCVSADGEGNIVGEGDLALQTRTTLDNLRMVLQAAGSDLEHVLKTTVFMLDISQRGVTHDIRKEYFGDSPPASTMVEVKGLGRPEYLIEIDAIAAIP